MPPEDEIELTLLLEAIRLARGYDFRSYARAPLERRLARALDAFGCRTLSGLQERVLHEPAVMPRLVGYLTVGATEMFRDPSFFRAVRERVVPYLHTYSSLKVWIPGCATGEEVYSLAIILEEEGLLERTQLYATDIDPEALRRAESGVYRLDRLSAYSRSYRAAGGRRSLADYYLTGGDKAVVHQRLRERVLFSDHSFATDGVFGEMQLISCRNVLMYFNRALQDRAVALFRDSLCSNCFLGLGAKETLAFSAHAGDFTEFVREERLYQRRR